GLPPFPRQLAQMDFSQLNTLCQSVGCEMIACAAVLETPQSLVRWLSPLGTQGARAVADRLASLRDHPMPVEIRRRWQAAYKRYLLQYRGTQLASMLGLSVLSAVYQRLPEPERELVDALADTAVREALGRTGRDDAYPDDDLAAVQAIAIRVLNAGAAMQRT